MSNKVQTILLAVAFAGAAQTALACTTCTPSGTTINLGNENNNALTANPSASATGSNNLNANPTNTLTSNPTLTANPTATSNSSGIGYGGNATGGNGYGGNATSSSTAQGGTAFGGNSSSYSAGGTSSVNADLSNQNIVGIQNKVDVTTGDQKQTMVGGDQTQVTKVDTKGTVGDIKNQATVESGAIRNTYSTVYKAAASTAYAGSVAGQGHGCFQHEGGWGAGVQVIAAGVSGNYNKGETYNKDCVADQAALAMIGKTGNPVSDALAAETAAKMAPNTVGEAIKVVPNSPLLGLFATYGAAPIPASAYAAPVAQEVNMKLNIQPVVAEPVCAKGTWNPQLGKCSGGVMPAIN